MDRNQLVTSMINRVLDGEDPAVVAEDAKVAPAPVGREDAKKLAALVVSKLREKRPINDLVGMGHITKQQAAAIRSEIGELKDEMTDADATKVIAAILTGAPADQA